MTKNQMRRAKKKEQKKSKAEVCFTGPKLKNNSNILQNPEPEKTQAEEPAPRVADDKSTNNLSSTDVVIADPALDDEDDTAFAVYRDILRKFGGALGQDDIAGRSKVEAKGDIFENDDGMIEEDEEDQPKLSKKKRKELNKVSVAELKALAPVPEVVDWQDVSSSDPRLLVQIKSQRNVVPVPTHWSMKREYLSSKRGIEKSAFRLPQFIAETGIAEMRDAVLEKQAEQSLKQKQRERVAPKMGRLDIDYQKLYDAFFRFQTKPELTRFGEVYYEGKESEVDYQHFRPGELSTETREALGIPAGAPPPWLINQQRFGPPPSYPALKIPGLNAPPPPGGSWGFHPGGWGKPPVDEFNRPLYGGDVFGLTATSQGHGAQVAAGEPIDRTLWGELQPREEESGEESDEEDEDESEDGDSDGERTGQEQDDQDPAGLETPSGFQTPGQPGYQDAEMDLRKQRRGYESEEPSSRSAYTVLPERQVRAEGFFGSDRAYDLAAAQQQGLPVLGGEDDGRKRKKPGDVDVAIDLDSLQNSGSIDKDELRQKFDDSTRKEGVGAQWERDNDLTDMIAEESRKRQRTEKERQDKRRQR